MSQGIGIYTHLYGLAVQAGFYSDAVECLTATLKIPFRVRSEDIFFTRHIKIFRTIQIISSNAQKGMAVKTMRFSIKTFICFCTRKATGGLIMIMTYSEYF